MSSALWRRFRARLAPPGRRPVRLLALEVLLFLRSTTPRRLANLLGLRLQRALRRTRLLGLPGYYFIDPINVCNLRCPLCPTGRGVLARPRGLMALSDLSRIVDEIAPYAYRVELYNWGEPLLHPNILEMIEYASRKRISVGLSSNLQRLDEQTAARLVESALARLTVSIDGATQEAYAAYRREGRLDVALGNLGLLLQARRRLRSLTPIVVWRMLVGRHNEHEVGAVRQMAREYGVDRFLTGPLYVDTGDPQQVAEWVPANPAYSPYPPGAGAPQNRWDCHDLWQVMVVNWDGGVAPCCWLHDPRHDLGNLSRCTVREVWNGPAYVSARRAIASGQRRSSEPRTICHLCRGHPHYLVD